MSDHDAHIELSHRISQWDAYIHTEKLSCVRCGALYLEADNIGQWQCFQSVYSSPYVDGISAIPHENIKRNLYVAADHASHEMSRVFDPTDDLLVNVNVISVLRHNMLSRASIIPATLAFVDTVGRPRPSDAPQSLGLCAVRRYDHHTARMALADRNLRHTSISRPTNPMLATVPLYHPKMPNGLLVKMREPAEHLYAEDELRILKQSHRVLFT